jgi:predicted transcriptional regulator
MANPRNPLSLRLDPDFHTRLQTVATKMKVARHTFAQAAIEAAVEAAERHAGIVFPIEFVVRRIPAGRSSRKSK